MTGFINVYKPRGLTSHQVVHRIRHITGIRAVGHMGTLDPEADGVLPIAVGRATKLIEFVESTPKTYEADVVLGVMTHSLDVDGRPVGRSGPPWPSADHIRSVTGWLTGHRWQVPPQVSALKVGGQRAYARVRQQAATWPAPRRVDIHAIHVDRVTDAGWTFRAVVGSGTYIRALVRDWGTLLGQAVHIGRLTRQSVGLFDRAHSWTLEDLARLGSEWRMALVPASEYLAIPRLPVSEPMAVAIRHGVIGAWPDVSGYEGPVALLHGTEVVAVIQGPPWRYRKVLGGPDEEITP
ncbi:MAG: tRNA pseudouridine(55) synthase TruB [Sulfobacillus sp.]|nr:tRNA pseudouridine(55) synthase TruB [Sulfobacillus sp.]